MYIYIYILWGTKRVKRVVLRKKIKNARAPTNDTAGYHFEWSAHLTNESPRQLFDENSSF